MEASNWGLKDKSNVLSSNNTKAAAYNDPASVLCLDLQNKTFEANFNWVVDKEQYHHADDYHEGKLDETKPCFETEPSIR